jgi:hypothetical protein
VPTSLPFGNERARRPIEEGYPPVLEGEVARA